MVGTRESVGQGQLKHRIPPYFEIVTTPDEFVFYGDDRYVTMSGESIDVLESALPALRDGATLEELADAAEIDQETAEELLGILESRSLLESIEIGGSDAVDRADPVRFHYRQRADHEHAAAAPIRFESPPLVVLPDGSDLPAEELDFGLPVKTAMHESRERLGDTDAIVSITFGHSPRTNLRYEDWARESGVPLLVLRLFMGRIAVGPFFIPGESASFETAYRREKTGREDPSTELRIEGELENEPTFPILPEYASVIETFVTTELRSYLAGIDDPSTLGAVIAFDIETLETERTPVLRLPDRAPDGAH